MNVTKGQVLRYALLPGFLPRIRNFFSDGFVYIAYFMAVLYRMIGLLPNGHPYLLTENFGRYSIRQVIAQAANNLVFDRKHLDQVVLFFTLLLGLVVLFIQIFLLIMTIFTQPAIAATAADWFQIPSSFHNFGPEQDIAMILLDRVFGTIGIFDSCVSTSTLCEDSQGLPISATTGGYPFPMHLALHQLLSFYSFGMAIIGAFIIIYFVIAMASETAQTGTPFGQRVNKAWVLPRLIMFFALLAPINIGTVNGGLNAAQLITLWTAKAGSNMASNGWAHFNNVLTGTYLGEVESLIARPNAPDIGGLMQFMFITKVCQISYQVMYGEEVRFYAVKSPISSPNHHDIMKKTPSYPQLVEFSDRGNITFRFGVRDEKKYAQYLGNVFPTCGEIILQVTDISEPGSLGVQRDFYTLIRFAWRDDELQKYAECMSRKLPADPNPECVPEPDDELINGYKASFDTFIKGQLDDHIKEQAENGNWDVPDALLKKGWAGAAIWYNRIAKMNGAVTNAVFNIPKPQTYPHVMEVIKEQRQTEGHDGNPVERFNPYLPNAKLARLRAGELEIAKVLYETFNFWETTSVDDSAKTSLSGNAIIDMLNLVLGTSGIYDMRRNADVHPLAQLTALGKGIVEATIRNALIGIGGTVGEGLSSIFPQFPGQAAGTAVSGLASTFAFAMLSMGVILFYVVPFLPFVFFIFAVSGWIKSIFEAIVAMPLWALAHLHVDGEGLPGRAASSGYFLLLEIFLRPILILFGLMASLSIFSALVSVLNEIFEVVVANLGGYDLECEENLKECTGVAQSPGSIEFYRQPVDQFFFTAMYAVIVYVFALASFKLIDQIPNNILRWMGQSVSTFQENAGDPAAKLSSSMYKGTQITSSQLRGGSHLEQLMVTQA